MTHVFINDAEVVHAGGISRIVHSFCFFQYLHGLNKDRNRLSDLASTQKQTKEYAEIFKSGFVLAASPPQAREEFDAAEYSSSEYVQRYANKKCPFVAIPVFPSRCFRHSFIGINTRSGIKTAKDLEGKRIGVALYTMTAAIFIRGILQHDYGVDFSNCTWVQGAINEKGAHGSPTVLPLLKPIKLEQGPPNKSLDQMIQDGVIDATIGTSMPESFRTNPNIARLFPDFVERERDHYKRTKIYPIMHLVAIKKSIYEKHPFVATSLFNAFQRASFVQQDA